MKYYLGIDVGGTKIAAGLVDSRLRVSRVSILPTSQTDLLHQLRQLIASYPSISGIGLAVPGPVKPDGTVTKLPNIPHFKQLNLKTYFSRKFKVPVHLSNDAKAFALAEATNGQGQGYASVVGVILGTGIGTGFVLDGRVISGKDGVAGELEHVIFPPGEMLRDYRKRAGRFTDAKAAKPFLKALFSMIVLSMNPEIIILGGGWSKLKGLKDLANQLTVDLGFYKNFTPVVISKLKHAGIIGAVLPLLQK